MPSAPPPAEPVHTDPEYTQQQHQVSHGVPPPPAHLSSFNRADALPSPSPAPAAGGGGSGDDDGALLPEQSSSSTWKEATFVIEHHIQPDQSMYATTKSFALGGRSTDSSSESFWPGLSTGLDSPLPPATGLSVIPTADPAVAEQHLAAAVEFAVAEAAATAAETAATTTTAVIDAGGAGGDEGHHEHDQQR